MNMKKCLLSVLFVFVVFGGVLKAEDINVKTDRPAMYFNLGSLLGGSGEFFNILPYGGFNLDFPIGKYVMLSPEVNLIFYYYIPALLAPGINLNFKGNSMFFGGGLVNMISFYSHHPEINLCLKLNAGVIRENMKFSIYLLTRTNRRDEYGGGIVVGVNASFKLKSPRDTRRK